MKNEYKIIADTSVDEVLGEYETSLMGISQAEAIERRKLYGLNELKRNTKKTWWVQLFQAFVTPFTIVLTCLTIISFFLDYQLASPSDKDLTGTLIIFVMVVASGIMTLIQSVKSSNAVDKLRSLVKSTTNIIRENFQEKMDSADVVPGDIIKLSAGDMVPADLRIVQARDLLISQAALTGESYPVEKRAETVMNCNDVESVTDCDTLAFMGSNVVSGTALGVVITTGTNTELGSVSEKLKDKKVVKTDFDTGISQTSWLLIRFMLVMAPIVIVITGLTKGNWLNAVMFGLSTAVGLTPEMLPVIVTTNLVKGAVSMAKKDTIVKDINSIQNFGSMDILCTDKTGTLTQDDISLKYYYDIDGNDDDTVLKYAYLNSFYQTGLDNLLDKAIVKTAKEKIAVDSLGYTKVDELPFDFTRRRMSTVVQDEDGIKKLVTKGAMEEITSVSNQILVNGQIQELSNAYQARLKQLVENLNQKGLRVLGLAIREFTEDGKRKLTTKDETEMIFIGCLVFLDPPKASAAEAISALHERGTRVKILTGDNEQVTKTVCQSIGFNPNGIVAGDDFAAMEAEEKMKCVEANDVFVKITPDQKAEIVRMLHDCGHVVGFLGDGINDALAMQNADVGISVDTAVDIAKESSSIILLKKDLRILEQGVVIGRQTFGNIMKYIKITCSSNFGNVFSVLIASAFLPFLPMQPIQLLLLNLIYDLSCLSISWDRMDNSYLFEPKRWDSKSTGKFMFYFGSTSSIFDVVTFLMMFWMICPQIVGLFYSSAYGVDKQLFVQLFNAGWFVESLWTQTFVLHALRTEKIPFIQSRASWILTGVTTFAVFVGSIIPYTAFGKGLGLVALPLNYWPLLIVIMGLYLGLVTVIKHQYVRRFGDLL